MTLHLTEAELDTLKTQQSVLLNGRLDDEARVKGVLVALARLIGARRSFAGYVLGGDFRFLKDGVGPQIEVYLQQVFRGFDADGNMLMSDPELEEINRRRRQIGAGVHHERRLQNRDLIERTTYFREAFEPAGMHHVIGISTPLPVGEAVFAFGFDGPTDPGFAGLRAEYLLGLVLPAFETGFQRAYRAAAAEQAMTAALDRLPGAHLRTSPPKGRQAKGHILPGPALPGARESWLVLPERSGPDPERLGEAARRHGLTRRQSEVMGLMLNGMSSAEIARALSISPHTARRHCEAVLKRLNVRSRAAIWSALSGSVGAE